LRWPKLRELKEAVTAVFSPRFTSHFPKEACVVPERYRGKPEFDTDTCIGCGACVNVCPTNALTMVDDTDSEPPKRIITQKTDACIFCGNCVENCTTGESIKLTNQWDLASLDPLDYIEEYEFELQLCERCGANIGTKKHLIWLYEKLGPLAYTNPSLLLAKSGELFKGRVRLPETKVDEQVRPRDFMKILCPKCKCELNIRL